MIKGYIVLTIVLIIDFFLYTLKGISIAGQLSDKILFWSWLVMTIIIAVWFIKKRWIKWYLGILGLLLILSLVPMGIPFIKLAEFTVNGNFERRIEDYILREDRTGVFSTPLIKIIKNRGLFEIEIDEMDFGECAGEYDTLSVVNDIDILEEGKDIIFVFEIRGVHCRRLLGNYRLIIYSIRLLRRKMKPTAIKHYN